MIAPPPARGILRRAAAAAAAHCNSSAAAVRPKLLAATTAAAASATRGTRRGASSWWWSCSRSRSSDVIVSGGGAVRRGERSRSSSSVARQAAMSADAEGQQTCGVEALPPEQLWGRIEEVYERAQQSGAAFRTETRTELVRDAAQPTVIEFVLRVAAALKAKPKGPEQTTGGKDEKPKKAFINPFLPYEEALWVAHLSSTHTLLLNKFNVVEKHVLVVTRQFESQADPLNANDLEATMQVLRAMPRGGVAFYNCGEHSGRSQPHKHLQVVPLPFDSGQSPRPPMADVVDAACREAANVVVELRELPYRAYAARLDDSVTGPQLEGISNDLLAACAKGLSAPVSYNVLLWRDAIMMVPRRQECCGPCAINSLGFAGTILVRSDDDLAFAKETGPLKMLSTVGVPWP